MSYLSFKHLQVEWEIVEEEHLVVTALSIQMLNEFLPIVKSCLPKFSLNSKKIDKQLIQDNIVKQLQEKNSDLIKIGAVGNLINIASVDFLKKHVFAEMKLYIDQHSTTSIFMEMNPGRFGYMLVYKTLDFTKIESDFSKIPVEIDIVHERRKRGFILKGPKVSCQDALSKIAMIGDSVFEKVLSVNWPGFEKFVHNDKVKDVLTQLQLQNQCLLKIQISDNYSRKSSEQVNTTFTCFSNCKIENTSLSFNLGDIMDDTSDVLVFPASSCLDQSLGPEIVSRGKHKS